MHRRQRLLHFLSALAVTLWPRYTRLDLALFCHEDGGGNVKAHLCSPLMAKAISPPVVAWEPKSFLPNFEVTEQWQDQIVQR